MGRLGKARRKARPSPSAAAPGRDQGPWRHCGEILVAPPGVGKSVLLRRRLRGLRLAPPAWREAMKHARGVVLLDDTLAPNPTGATECDWRGAVKVLDGARLRPFLRVRGGWPAGELDRLARGGLVIAIEEVHRQQFKWIEAFAVTLWNVRRNVSRWRGASDMRMLLTAHVLQGVHELLRSTADRIDVAGLQGGAARFAAELAGARLTLEQLLEAPQHRFQRLL